MMLEMKKNATPGMLLLKLKCQPKELLVHLQFWREEDEDPSNLKLLSVVMNRRSCAA